MTESVVPIPNDYHQYYRSCYCLLDDKLISLGPMEGPNIHYSEIVEEYIPYQRCNLQKIPKISLAVDLFTKKTSFVPQYGYIATSDKTVAYVALMPNRQYFRDFTPNRLRCTVPNIAEAGIYSINPYDHAALPVILRNNKFPWSAEEALSKLYGGDLLGVPLSYDYALVATFTNKDAVLFRKNKMIGTVNKKAEFRPSREDFNDLPNFPSDIKRGS